MDNLTSLEGLQYAKILASLNISGNEITDFSALEDLQQLENLNAHPQLVTAESLKGSFLIDFF